MANYANDDGIEEQTKNFFRLARLTMTEGTSAVRECVLDRLPQGQTLHTMLALRHRKMNDLHRRRLISVAQMKILYPDGTNADLSRIDITLWIILLRNLVPEASVTRFNWNRAPTDDETDWFHDVVRILETRNSLFHCQRPEMDADTFERQWNFVTAALRRLNVNVDADAYRHAEVRNRDAVKVAYQEIVQEVMLEKMTSLEEQLASQRHHVYALSSLFFGVLVVGTALVIALVYAFRQPPTCERFLQYEAIGKRF